ncbi:sulfite exporter TauE/SafE family protein [Aporhodopirellula aestuarii]|uniref:Probable membrane transporter protein n=1 Tax=Aporhodopirellula aestuarii TaxID=2950107 RepID=A0ABT0U6J0_9BACT|nr:sulfite exporter TauE/SafE family protein [Aporhodopirellula aestuarii]MCM2372567.1 sulfite exporter TauE/SafE family protein [Aporhodopirellula aestuarii]
MIWQILLYGSLVVAGFLAGIVNTVAGGGSFLTLPALLLFGLDPKTANATNRIAILCSTAAAVATFRKHGHLDTAATVRLATPTLLGVPVGALLAIHLPAETFERLFGVMFIAMAILLLANPKRFLDSSDHATYPVAFRFPVFFAIGVYVGFIQAGMGILLLLAMSYFTNSKLVSSNAIKNSIGFCVTLAAATVFMIYGMIDWVPGLVMAVGNVAGGVVGAKLAIERGSRFVFFFLVVVMLATGIKLILP